MRRFDHEYAQLKALLDGGELGPRAGAALRAPQPRRAADVRQRDDGAGLAGARGRRDPFPVRRGDRLDPDHQAGRESRLRPQGLADPQIAIMRTASGRHVDVELFVTTGVAYEVRTEVVAEKGSAMIGLDVGLVRKSAPGTWGGQITPGFRERFGQAYDTEFQRWVDAVRRGRHRRLHRRPGRLGRLRRRRGVRGRRRVAEQRAARRGDDGRPRARSRGPDA